MYSEVQTRPGRAFLITIILFYLLVFLNYYWTVRGPDGGAEVAEVPWRLLEMLTLPCIQTVFYSLNNLLLQICFKGLTLN